MARMAAIGIDLGTSKCCVGVLRDGKVKILENELGNKTTPSYVAFTSTERLIGEYAKKQLPLNPTNTVFGTKRLLGRMVDDLLKQNDQERFPFTLSCSEPMLKVTYKEESRMLRPEQISAMLLKKMKNLAEFHLGTNVEGAVISVPGFFSNAQRQATIDAAEIAGLKVFELISETTAAAIAYEAKRNSNETENVVLCDFGGGKLEVSILIIKKGSVAVRSISGDTRFGGIDFDNCLLKYFLSQFQRKHGRDLSGMPKAIERLRSACEKAKRTLTLLPSTTIQIDCLDGDTDFEAAISREIFESFCFEMLKDALVPVLTDVVTSIKLSDIDEIILVGGSSRVPMFQKLIKQFFHRTDLDKSINPDECVAYGAAVKAALLSGDNSVEDVSISDAIPRAICLVTSNHTFVHNFERYSTVPSRCVLQLDIRHFPMKLYIHELSFNDNSSANLGEFCLQELLQKESFIHFVNMSYNIDSNGIYTIELIINNERLFDGIITTINGRLTKDEIVKMATEEKLYELDTTEEQERIAAITELESFCFTQKASVNENTSKMPEYSRNKIRDMCDTIIKWVDCTEHVSKAECQTRKHDLEKLCSSLSQQMHSDKNIDSVLKRPATQLCLETNLDDNVGEKPSIILQFNRK